MPTTDELYAAATGHGEPYAAAVAEAVADIRSMTVYTLARLADCAEPDTDETAGADFLRYTARDTAEHIAYVDDVRDIDVCDAAHDIADGAPSVYTAHRWAQYVDLAAYTEPIADDYGADVYTDPTAGAGVALYAIAHRLTCALIEHAIETVNDYLDGFVDGEPA
jgi:hypothetical protein